MAAWREHPSAREELLATTLHLDDARPGLGDLFVDAVEQAVLSVQRSPHAWPRAVESSSGAVIRTRAIAPFRIRVVYTVLDDTVLVLAYAHESRRPGYWSDRLPVQ